ncbi:MAG: PD-(D/E)XK nuclease family protein, partial [Clostridia bacterium]|nr:PD-(D/E)XK nuclease family protein [Clostridia bacterium]
QLLLYLFTLCRSRSVVLRRRLGLPRDAELLPAGMLYCAALAPDLAVVADAEENDIIAQADAKLTRRGIVLDDEHVLRAMDAELSGKYIPCRLLKRGDYVFSSPESRATADEFVQLYDKLGSTIRRVASELRAGRADANPRRHAGEYPCRSCPSAPICRAAKK